MAGGRRAGSEAASTDHQAPPLNSTAAGIVGAHGMHRRVGLGVIPHNLINIGKAKAAPPTRRHKPSRGFGVGRILAHHGSVEELILYET